MRRISTATLSNQNISAALLVLTHTATADRDIFVRIFLDQIAGSGTYNVIRTMQRGGAGAEYQAANFANIVNAGITNLFIPIGLTPMLNTDVLRVYVLGLGGDTATPDIIVEVWEQDYLRPITAGQFLTVVDASGRVDLGEWLGVAPDALYTGKVQVNTMLWNNGSIPASAVSGVPKVDVTYWIGIAPATPAVAGVPTTNTQYWRGSLPNALVSGDVPAADSAGTTTLVSRLTSTRAGYLDLINTINSAVAVIDGIVDSILLDTATLPSDPADQSLLTASISATQSAITAQTDIIKAKTNNLPASPAATGAQMDLVAAPNATAVTAIQAGLATAANQTTILNRLGAWTGTGVNTVLGAFRATVSKAVSLPSDLTFGGLTYDNTTDALEALRDRGDAAWITGSGGDSAAAIADAVWDEAKVGHVAAGSFGERVNADVTAISTDTTAANNAESFFDGTGYAGTGNTIPTVTTLTNAPSDSAGTTTLLSRLSDLRAGYLDALAGFGSTLLVALQALARKDIDSPDLAGTFDSATDSQEALREKLDTLASAAPDEVNFTINELDVE